MKHGRTFTISLCLNLALAGVAVWLLWKTVSPTPPASAATVPEAMTAPAAASRFTASEPPSSITYSTNHFSWSNVEAEDFEQLATNLRAIGCPEKTIRDVVVARARRLLDMVSKEAEPKLSFWTAGLRRARAQHEAEHRSRLAQERIVAQLERVVGQDVFLEDPKVLDEFEAQAIMRFVVGSLPDETFFKVAAKLAWFGERRDELKSRTQGVWLDTDEAELAQLRTRYHHEFAVLLNPRQFEEMTARIAIMPQMDRVKFEATDLNPAEVRQLGMIRARFSEPLSGQDFFFGENSMTDEHEQELKAAERQFLGEARFAQLGRAADSDFKTLFDLGRDNNLPRDAAVKVFDLRQLIAQEVEQLRKDKSLADADRQQQLAQLQADAQQAVLQVLGASTSGQYLGRGGAWLTNVNGL